jgi:hypothetical protein
MTVFFSLILTESVTLDHQYFYSKSTSKLKLQQMLELATMEVVSVQQIFAASDFKSQMFFLMIIIQSSA